MSIAKDQVTEVRRRLDKLGVRTEDLQERFVRGTGHGGQKINKTSSCVHLKHIPTGIEVRCHDSRSRARNRLTARVALCQKLEERQRRKTLEARQEREKKRRRARPRPRKVKERILEKKRQRSRVKSLRRRPHRDD